MSLIFGTSAIWGQVIRCYRCLSWHHRIFSSISGLYPLDARGTHLPNCGNKRCLQTLPDVLWTFAFILEHCISLCGDSEQIGRQWEDRDQGSKGRGRQFLWGLSKEVRVFILETRCSRKRSDYECLSGFKGTAVFCAGPSERHLRARCVDWLCLMVVIFMCPEVIRWGLYQWRIALSNSDNNNNIWPLLGVTMCHVHFTLINPLTFPNNPIR